MSEKKTPAFAELVEFAKVFDIPGVVYQNSARMKFLEALYNEHVHKITTSDDEWVAHLANLKQEYLVSDKLCQIWEDYLDKSGHTPETTVRRVREVAVCPDNSMASKERDERKAFANALFKDPVPNYWKPSMIHLDPKACKSQIGDARSINTSTSGILAFDSIAAMFPDLHNELTIMVHTKPVKPTNPKNKPWYTSFSGKAGKPPRY